MGGMAGKIGPDGGGHREALVLLENAWGSWLVAVAPHKAPPQPGSKAPVVLARGSIAAGQRSNRLDRGEREARGGRVVSNKHLSNSTNHTPFDKSRKRAGQKKGSGNLGKMGLSLVEALWPGAAWHHASAG